MGALFIILWAVAIPDFIQSRQWIVVMEVATTLYQLSYKNFYLVSWLAS